MNPDSAMQSLGLVLQVFFVDLLLSGDNAIVIALACRSLPEAQRRQAMVLGAGLAIGLRIALTLLAGAVMQVPGLKLLGGLALTVIALQLTVDAPGSRADSDVEPIDPGRSGLAAVVATVVVADLAMSADNVLALVAVARGSVAVLVLGLVLSVPLLMFGSWFATRLAIRHPILIPAGGALLGWLAGDIAVSDPLYASALERQSPALLWAVPALVAIYVLVQGRIVHGARAGAAALRPRPRRRARSVDPGSERPAPEPLPAVRTFGEPTVAAVPAMPVDRGRDGAPTPIPAPVSAEDPAESEPPPVAGRWWPIPLAGFVAAFLVYGLATRQWMPIPIESTRYDCPGTDVSIYYRPGGGQRLQLVTRTGRAGGVVRYDNRIDWDDERAAGTALGIAPPTRVVFADATSLRVDGGLFENLACLRVADAARTRP